MDLEQARQAPGWNERTGVELPWVYDGISVWIVPGVGYVNRWDPVGYRRRYRATQEWIDAQE